MGGVNISKDLNLRFGCHVIAYGNVHKAIRNSMLAEKSGFDSIGVPDHLFHPLMGEFLKQPPWDAFTVLSAIGTRTRNVMLFPGVTDSVRRHPAVLAHEMATLDHITNGRMILAIGAGELFNFSPLKNIDWQKPFTRFRETLHLIKALWDSSREHPVNFEGEYFKIQDAFLALKPIQRPKLPIYVGGYGAKMRKLIGEQADGWLPWIYTPEQYKQDFELIRKSAEEAGRNPEEIDRAVMLPTVVLSDSDKALQLSIPRGRICLALRTPLLRDLGYSQIANETDDMWQMAFNSVQRKNIKEVVDQIPDKEVEKFVIAGSPDGAIEKIEDFLESGVNHIIVFPTADFEETLDNYKNKIIPYFKDYS